MVDKKKGDKFDEDSVGVKAEEFTEIMPIRDYVLHSPPRVTRLQIKKGESIRVPTVFLNSLKTEKVI